MEDLGCLAGDKYRGKMGQHSLCKNSGTANSQHHHLLTLDRRFSTTIRRSDSRARSTSISLRHPFYTHGEANILFHGSFLMLVFVLLLDMMIRSQLPGATL